MDVVQDRVQILELNTGSLGTAERLPSMGVLDHAIELKKKKTKLGHLTSLVDTQVNLMSKNHSTKLKNAGAVPFDRKIHLHDSMTANS